MAWHAMACHDVFGFYLSSLYYVILFLSYICIVFHFILFDYFLGYPILFLFSLFFSCDIGGPSPERVPWEPYGTKSGKGLGPGVVLLGCALHISLGQDMYLMHSLT